MSRRLAETAEQRKQRLEQNARKQREQNREAEHALDEMVKRSIKKHGA